MATQDVDEEKSRTNDDAHTNKPSSKSQPTSNDDRNLADKQHGSGTGPSAKAGSPSLLVTWIIAGLVSVVCGSAGAAAYWHFVASEKTDEHAAKNADALKNAVAEEDAAKGQLHQAQAEWKTAMEELRQAQTAAQMARRGQEDTQAILDFFKNNLLSAGRSGDTSLTAAFWEESLGKDVTLRKAVDVTESRVAEAFADRPAAEASVREMLGLAYLNLKDPAKAVKEYERALALRDAVQGINDSETAACRNQLAVAYRLAGRTADAARLFDRNDNSPTHASALAIRGAMLLLEKNAAEAELKLRASLTIRQKMMPDDWATFDTMSMLGEALLDQKKFAAAETLLVSGYEGLKKRETSMPAPERLRIVAALERLVKLYTAWDKPEKATKWRAELDAAGSPKK